MRATGCVSNSVRCVTGHVTRARATLIPRPCKWGRSYSSSTSSTPAQEPVIFSGIQPTGVPHLGNYLGALRQWVKLQDDAQPGTKLLFSIVDLHALTVPQDASQLRKWRAEAFATLLAVGLDPKRSTIFYQSAVRVSLSITYFRAALIVGSGAGTCGVDVDSKHGGFDGVSFTDDPVEGEQRTLDSSHLGRCVLRVGD